MKQPRKPSASKPRPSGRPVSGKRKPARRQEGPRVKWEGLRPLVDEAGREIKRHFKLETLASAVEKSLREDTRFLHEPIQGAIGPSPLTSVVFELLIETNYKLVFRMTATNAKRKRGVFGFIAAKNDKEYSSLVQKEHAQLASLHELMPQRVIQVQRMGSVYLPDRHRRESLGREVTAYTTRWPGGFHELCLTPSGQFGAMLPTPQAFTRDHSEIVRRRLVELVAASFDGRTKSCMVIPDVISGDLMVTKPGAGPPKVKLLSSRTLIHRMTPPKVVRLLLEAKWPLRGRTFTLRPDDPNQFYEALRLALGKEEALAWLKAYVRARQFRTVPNHPYLDNPTLAAWGVITD